MNLINLTNHYSGGIVAVNMDQVCFLTTALSGDTEMTEVCFNDITCHVNESIREIRAKVVNQDRTIDMNTLG